MKKRSLFFGSVCFVLAIAFNLSINRATAKAMTYNPQFVTCVDPSGNVIGTGFLCGQGNSQTCTPIICQDPG